MSSGKDDLKLKVWQAFELGKGIDLEDAHYGPSSWGTKQYVDRPSPYYHFLAGWCRATNAARVIEVGTHYGGSTLAIHKGIVASADPKLVTIDVTNLNAERLARETAITKIVGSGADRDVQDCAVAALGSERCDLLYIDALKDMQFVLSCLDGFISRAEIGYAILDDINIVPEMRRMWNDVMVRYGEHAIDVSSLIPEVRAPNVGFGLIRLMG